jgi:hypothetical protein
VDSIGTTFEIVGDEVIPVLGFKEPGVLCKVAVVSVQEQVFNDLSEPRLLSLYTF